MNPSESIASLPLLAALDQHAIVSVTDANGTIEYVNDRFCEISGYKASELIGANHRLLKSGLHPPPFYLDMWAELSSGKTWCGKICNRKKSGELYWVEATIVPELDPEKGLPRRYVSIRTDITAAKVAQRRAEIAEERYRRGQKFAQIGTWDLNLQTHELYWPEHTASLFGYPPQERTTSYENFLAAVHPDDLELVLAAVQKCRQGRVPYECEHRCLWPDGTVRWLAERGDVTRYPEDHTLHLLGAVYDITERKQAEAELEVMRSHELAQSSELVREHERRVQTELRVREQGALLQERGRLLAQREEMLAALAHEVRQPLNNASAALQSAARAMAQPTEDRERVADRLQRASAVITQVTSALDNTLADAVLMSGDEPLARHDTDVDTLIDLVIADIDPTERSQIHRERTTNTRTALMNASLMRLALRNLVANARTYSPKDSSVVVRVSDSDDPLALVIDVCDQGPGIPPELLPRLFGRGARGDQVNNPFGHGLGLYLVRRIMEMHGGEVQVQPGTPRGLTMRLLIPQGCPE